jgi:hypothetical protein
LLLLAGGGAFSALASGLTYTCNPSGAGAISSATCNYLNTTIAGIYNSTFTNANANIYIEYGNTGLAMTEQYYDYVTFAAYLTAMEATASTSDSVDLGALAALQTLDSAIYGSGNVEVAGALGMALGFPNMTGITSSGGACTLGTANCYAGLVTISSTAPLYYRSGNEASNAYDFYSTVEHETNEVLGTTSCIDTSGASLTNDCGFNLPSAADLFRYQSSGHLVLMSTTAGAYFSYNGGASNGAMGALYNTVSNDNDYGDFISGCPTVQYIQDGTGCAGHDAGLNITNDGAGATPGPEINILDAVGYNLVGGHQAPVAPEPGTTEMFICGLTALGAFAYHRNRR